MFSIDILGNIERLSIYLMKPSGTLLCCLDDNIDETSASMTVGINQQYGLSFTLNYSNLSWSDYIQEGMYLCVDKYGFFRLDQPTSTYDGIKDTKNIVAHSCDVELEDKNCAISVNMGTDISQEFLVKYEDGETEELLNPYTNIPYDWIVLYNMFPEQLTTELQKVNSGHYGIANPRGEIIVTDATLIQELQSLFDIIPRLKNRIISTKNAETGFIDYSLVEYVIFNYDSSGKTVTSITLTSLYVSRMSTLIEFYKKYRKQLSLLSLVTEEAGGWSIGKIYGVSDGDYSLANKKYQFEINENVYSFLTQTLAQTINCVINFDLFNRKINITPAEQIGENTGIVLSYETLMNTLNISSSDDTFSTRLFVSGADDLDISQVNFGMSSIEDISYKLNVKDNNGKRIYASDDLAQKYAEYIEYRESLRDEYVQLSKDYSNFKSNIYDIKYRVPNDSLKTDWGTFTQEELNASLTSYKNLLCALITLYKDDYGNLGLNSDGSVNENYIKQTMYWYDYEAYKNTITEIECAISTYPYYSDQTKWTKANLQKYKDAIKAWETDWTLYGTIELQAKIDTYKQNMDLLADSSVIRVSDNSDEIKQWSQLTDSEKSQYGNLESNYNYDTYMIFYDYMISAKAYLNDLLSSLDELQVKQDATVTKRTQMVNSMLIDNYFTSDECDIIYRLYRDADYSNDNILVTSVDTTDEKIDKMYELLKDAEQHLSELSRPQLKFEVDADNLLGLVDFKALWKDFKPGNYILVQYKDDTYIKLRMLGFTFNPCLPCAATLTIAFSNYIRSKVGVSDLESLLGSDGYSSGSSGSGSSSGGSGNGYGASDDINVDLTNTMLVKLLNSEEFGTRVTNVILDTIDVNSITAKSATFGGLSNGTTQVDGKCLITGYVRDEKYNGKNGDIDNTNGSVINLESGKFSFAGGKLIWDGSNLKISGDGSGLDIKSNESITGLSTDIKANASGISAEIKRATDAEGNLSTRISANAENITLSASKILKESKSYADLVTESAISSSNNTTAEKLKSYYTKTETDSQIKISADAINLQVSSNLETAKEYADTSASTAQTNAISSSNNTTAEKLKSYYTKTETDSQIKVGIDGIGLSAYCKTTEAQSMANAAKSDAKSYTDTALGSYVTTTTWSTLDVKVDGINTEVGKKVSTSDYTASNIVSKINQTAEAITINANKINLNGAVTANNYFKINADGSIVATGGTIASFTISNGYLFNGINIGTANSCGIGAGKAKGGSDDWIFWAGNGNFRVALNGYVYASNANISGAITATSLTLSNVLYVKDQSGTSRNAIDGYSNTEAVVLSIGIGYPDITLRAPVFCSSNLSCNGDFSAGGTTYVQKLVVNYNKQIWGYTSGSTLSNLLRRTDTDNIWVGASSYVAENIYLSAKNIYKHTSSGNTSLSDKRDKYDIQEITNAKEFIMGIQPKKYKFIDGTSNRYHTGFIAQELEETMLNTTGDLGVFVKFPKPLEDENTTVVNLDDDSTYVCGLRYEELIAPVVSLLQEHEMEILELKQTINEMKAKMV